MSLDESIRNLERMQAEDAARIDISQPVADLCKQLGFDPNTVARLDVHPAFVTAEFYVNHDGSKQITDRGNVAFERQTFKVRT